MGQLSGWDTMLMGGIKVVNFEGSAIVIVPDVKIYSNDNRMVKQVLVNR